MTTREQEYTGPDGDAAAEALAIISGEEGRS